MQPPENVRNDAQRQFVGLHMGGAAYAIAIEDVREIVEITTLTPLPSVHPSVCGVTNLRGSIIPVVDLWRLLHGELPETATANSVTDDDDADVGTRTIVLGVDDRVVGCQVDRVDQVMWFDKGEIQTPPEGLADIAGVVGLVRQSEKLTIVLDAGVIARTIVLATEEYCDG